MENKGIILYASCGEGHKKAAEALGETLGWRSFDLLDFASEGVKIIYSFGYQLLVSKYPFLWRLIYEVSKYFFIRELVNALHRIIFKKFFVFILQTKPELIISTHFFSPHLISWLKKRVNLTSLVLVTDFRVHPFWIDKEVDLYFVPVDETREDLIKLGVSSEKIVVSGLPLRGGFYGEFSPDRGRKQFSLGDKPALLVFSSAFGNIPFVEQIIKELKDEFILFIIYGKNRRLKKILDKYRTDSLRTFAYYENIRELMSLSLAIITKPGGLTVFEALKLDKPLIFTHYTWGQEKGNMDVVINSQAGFYAGSIRELKMRLNYLRENIDSLRAKVHFEVKDGRKIIKERVEKILVKCETSDVHEREDSKSCF